MQDLAIYNVPTRVNSFKRFDFDNNYLILFFH